MCRRLPESEPAPAPVPTATATSRRGKVVFRNGRFLTEDGAKLTPAQIEFGRALDEWKRVHPTFSDILDILMGLGYRQVKKAG